MKNQEKPPKVSRDFYRSKDDTRTRLREIKNFAEFKAWFKNVYLYHFLIPTVAVIAGIAVAASVIVSIVTATSPDAEIVIASRYGFDLFAVRDLEEELGELIGDINGDGRKYVSIRAFVMSDDTYEGMNSRMAFSTIIASGSIYLVIADEDDAIFGGEEDSPLLQRIESRKLYEQLSVSPEAVLAGYIFERAKTNRAEYDAAVKILDYLK